MYYGMIISVCKFLVIVHRLSTVTKSFIIHDNMVTSTIRCRSSTLFYNRISPLFSAALPPPSQEQLDIIKALQDDKKNNISVNAVAGSGKTTVVLQLASSMPLRNILLLTYNARLKAETRKKADIYDLKNLEVHSFHAMARKYYDNDCARDDGLSDIVDKLKKPLFGGLPNYDIIVVDEAQDMTMIYNMFVRMIIRDVTSQYAMPQLLVIGDERQELFAFTGADCRYLTMSPLGTLSLPDEPASSRRWLKKSLHTSYRVTGNMATFVNNVLLRGEDRMIAFKGAGDPVDYFMGDTWKSATKIANEIVGLIKSGTVNAEDVFVLSPSIKAGEQTMKSPIQKSDKPSRVTMRPIQTFENIVSAANIPIYIPSSDDSELRDELTSGKMVFSTFHQSKGLERKIVVIFDFSRQYFDYYAKKADKHVCPNTLYVAATRAIDKLYLVGHSTEEEKLPFLDQKALDILSTGERPAVRLIRTKGYISPPMKSLQNVRKSVKVRDLCNFVPESFMFDIRKLLTSLWVEMATPESKLNIPISIGGERTHQSKQEYVADINGLAIPAMFEMKLKHHCTIFRELEISCTLSTNQTLAPFIVSSFKKLPHAQSIESGYLDPNYFLNVATVYRAAASVSNRKAYLSTLKQILKYDWISEEDAAVAVGRLEKLVFEDMTGDYEAMAKDVRFEEYIDTAISSRHDDTQGNNELKLTGRIDILTPNVLWEIKCVQTLTEDHRLQLAVYAWMWLQRRHQKSDKMKKAVARARDQKFRLANLITSEVWELDVSSEANRNKLDCAIHLLIKAFNEKDTDRISNEEFLQVVQAAGERLSTRTSSQSLNSEEDEKSVTSSSSTSEQKKKTTKEKKKKAVPNVRAGAKAASSSNVPPTVSLVVEVNATLSVIAEGGNNKTHTRRKQKTAAKSSHLDASTSSSELPLLTLPWPLPLAALRSLEQAASSAGEAKHKGAVKPLPRTATKFSS